MKSEETELYIPEWLKRIIKPSKEELKDFFRVLVLCFMVAVLFFIGGGRSVCHNSGGVFVPLAFNQSDIHPIYDGYYKHLVLGFIQFKCINLSMDYIPKGIETGFGLELELPVETQKQLEAWLNNGTR